MLWSQVAARPCDQRDNNTLTEMNSQGARPSEEELARGRELTRDFIATIDAIAPGETVQVTSAKLTGPVDQTQSGEVLSIRTEPTYPGEVIYGNYPVLGALLEGYFAQKRQGLSWAEWTDVQRLDNTGSVILLQSELSSIENNEHATENQMRRWTHVRANSPDGTIEPGIPVLVSLATLHRALVTERSAKP
jgi:hypothetical protein